MKPRSRATRRVSVPGKLIVPTLFSSMSRLVKAIKVAGMERLVRAQLSAVSEVRFVSELVTEKLMSGLPERSSTDRFVRVAGIEKLVS